MEGLTSPERVVYPEAGITKGEVARYYLAMAPRILPHVAGRPLSLVRCPRGLAARCFYQRHHGKGFPPSVRGVTVQQKDGPREHLVIDDADGLLALIQYGGLEIHPWGCRADRLDQPDRLVFDLDPAPDVDWGEVIQATLEIRDRLQAFQLTSYAKTTGGKGMHVVAPLERGVSWQKVSAFSEELARSMIRDSPQRYLGEIAKDKRSGRIYLDFERNWPGATSVAPYSTRARAGAPVSTPVAWSEVTPGLDPSGLTLRTVPARPDPWEGFFQLRQTVH